MSTLRPAAFALEALGTAVDRSVSLVRGLADRLAVVRVEILVDSVHEFELFEVLQVQEAIENNGDMFFHRV